MSEPTELRIDARGVATLTLNRPERRNAFDAALIARLHEQLTDLEKSAPRVLVLRGAGPSFCAGADLEWMRESARFGTTENERDALALARMLHALDQAPCATLALVHGAAIGGGAGLVACCDVAIASETARFGFSEVRLGLVPATISPYVVAAIGPRAARRYFLTGERFDAPTAERIGLVHEVAGTEELERRGEEVIGALLEGAPRAELEARDLVRMVHARRLDDLLLAETAGIIATRRASPEGREGIAAFLEKRRPAWHCG